MSYFDVKLDNASLTSVWDTPIVLEGVFQKGTRCWYQQVGRCWACASTYIPSVRYSAVWLHREFRIRSSHRMLRGNRVCGRKRDVVQERKGHQSYPGHPGCCLKHSLWSLERDVCDHWPFYVWSPLFFLCMAYRKSYNELDSRCCKICRYLRTNGFSCCWFEQLFRSISWDTSCTLLHRIFLHFLFSFPRLGSSMCWCGILYWVLLFLHIWIRDHFGFGSLLFFLKFLHFSLFSLFHEMLVAGSVYRP